MKTLLCVSLFFTSALFAAPPSLKAQSPFTTQVRAFDVPNPNPRDPKVPLAFDVPNPNPKDPKVPLAM
jgi:hypothetical protein